MDIHIPEYKKEVKTSNLVAMDRLNSRSSKSASSSIQSISQRPSAPMSANMFIDRYSLNGRFGSDKSATVENHEYRTYLEQLCRELYDSNPVAGACIDVYSRFPVMGMDLECKDESIEKFYKDIFFEQLNYKKFLIELGREYWTVGEAFALADWDDDMNTYVSEDLIEPSMITVTPVPLTDIRTYEIEPTDDMRKIVSTREPIEVYEAFVEQYPEIVEQIQTNQNIQLDSDHVNSIIRTVRPSATRGTPVMKRALRDISYQERIEDATKAIADRLLGPLTMFKLGTANLGDGEAWIPTPDQMDDFRELIDTAMNSDFRTLVTHFAVESDTLLSAERLMPLKTERDSIEERIFMAFGLTSDIFKTSGSATYASAAVSLELAMMMLSTYQEQLVDHYEKRAKKIAEANEFFDYEIVDGKRKVIEEDYSYYDDDKGKVITEKRPKLLYPELKMRAVNFRNESNERDFLMALKDAGVPIPNSMLTLGLEYNQDEVHERVKDEDVKKAMYQVRTDVAIYNACIEQGLPVPSDVLGRIGESMQTLKTMSEGGDINVTMPDAEADVEADANTETTEPATDDKPKKDDKKKKKDKAVDETDATGGGARPNISDNKKKDAPKK